MRAATLKDLGVNCLVIVVFCGISSVVSSAQVWNRAARFGGVSSDAGMALKVTPAGDRFLTGNFSSSMKIGQKTLTSAGDTDIFLARYGQWVVAIGGAEHDEATDIAIDSSGNVYATGWFTDSATFHSMDGTAKSVAGSNATIFLAKYSGAGVLLWVQTGEAGFVSINRGQGVAIDAGSGAAYLTGISQGSTVFSSADGNSGVVPGGGSWHMMVRIENEFSPTSYVGRAYSSDGLTWTTPENIYSGSQFPPYSHDAGIEGDRVGNLAGNGALIGFGAPYDLAPVNDWAKWNLYTVPLAKSNQP